MVTAVVMFFITGCTDIKIYQRKDSSRSPASALQIKQNTQTEFIQLTGGAMLCQNINLNWKCAGFDFDGHILDASYSGVSFPAWWNILSLLKTTPTAAPVLNGFQQISVSYNSAIDKPNYNGYCGVKNGNVYCWGANNYGQLGNSTLIDSSFPVMVQGLLAPAVSVEVGFASACAILQDGRLQCWGLLYRDQNFSSTLTAQLIPEANNVMQISNIGPQVCYLKVDGSVWCWGDNSQGALGNSSVAPGIVGTKFIAPAVQVNLSGPATQLDKKCAVVNGGVECWGSNTFGLADPEGTTDVMTPKKIASLSSGVTQLSSDDTWHQCALKNGEVYCWGFIHSLLGTNSNNLYGVTKIPDLPNDIEKFDATFANATENLCFKRNGQTHYSCYGKNNYGQFGNGASGSDVLETVDINF